MQLKELTLAGFKSFAQQTRLEFPLGMTGIVGPNGVGKSNIADALRWVLGEQSQKSLRGKNHHDVIFAGTATAPARHVARVSLTLSNEGERRLAGESAELMITRICGRGEESEYLLNGDPIRLLDLQQFLAQTGIGARSYAVISQGTVDRYLTATPAVRRELFDEATGVAGLKLSLRQAEQKLARAAENGRELTTILEELAPRLTLLSRQMKRYEQRDQIAQELRSAEQAWRQQRWQTASRRLASATQELERCRQEVEAARVDHAKREETKSPLLTQVIALLKRCQAALRSDERRTRATLDQEITAVLAALLAPRRETAVAAAERRERAAARSLGAAESILAQTQTDFQNLEDSIRRDCGTSALAAIQAAPPGTGTTVTRQEVEELQRKLAAIGEVDPLVAREHTEVVERITRLTAEQADAAQTQTNGQILIRSLQQDIEQQFRQQFSVIQRSFATYFAQLFGGGSATLQLSEAGVEIVVAPPHKKPAHVQLLSGGEKALTSLALVLAVVQIQKPPFLVLDEVDAALDEANSYRFAELVGSWREQTQMIVITHNRETMAQADVLYGVTMDKGISQVYSVKMTQVAEKMMEMTV